MKIAIDFDGTCVKYKYPEIGEDIGAVPVLKKIVDSGHEIILLTMRSEDELHQAYNWLKERGIYIWAVNMNPEQSTWTKSPKVFANIYIDDAALGCPLVLNDGERPYVDWVKAEQMLIDMGVIT